MGFNSGFKGLTEFGHNGHKYSLFTEWPYRNAYPLSPCILYTGLWEKQWSMEFNVAQPDGSTPVAINAWFALRRTMETGHGGSRNEDN